MGKGKVLEVRRGERRALEMAEAAFQRTYGVGERRESVSGSFEARVSEAHLGRSGSQTVAEERDGILKAIRFDGD